MTPAAILAAIAAMLIIGVGFMALGIALYRFGEWMEDRLP